MSDQESRSNVVIITGASTGIGRALALSLAEGGSRLALGARNAALLEETAAAARQRGGEALSIPCDVTDPAQVERLVQAALTTWGKVDVLVSNAGQYLRKPVLELSIADLEQSMAVNFYGHAHAVLAVLPAMLRQGHGHIILMATMNAKKGIPPDAPYAAAKFALSGFGDILRQELRPHGIAVTTIYPGRVDTPMISDLAVPWISAKITPEATARAIERAMRTRPAEVILPPQAILLHLVNVFSPRLADWFVRRLRLEGWKAQN
jgi:NAD(P)-dependent dehydrogenase (short-subunit alcohol dehydrogenase family)